MPAKDVYHDRVVNALIKDGWTITDDPLRLTFGGQNFYVDLGAEHPIGAKKGGRKIAVEIKSFVSDSPMRDLELALGQYHVIHIDIVDDKVWIQYDGTSPGIASELTEAGIPRAAIVLAFHPPEVRQHTGYALA